MPKPKRSMKTTRKTINCALRDETGAGGVVAESDMVVFQGVAGQTVLRRCCINGAASGERPAGGVGSAPPGLVPEQRGVGPRVRGTSRRADAAPLRCADSALRPRTDCAGVAQVEE